MENTKVNGVVWDSGTHHLYVDGKPTTLYVPPESIKDTYNQMKMEIKQNESIPIGIDHLNKQTFKDNDILKKLDLLHVGDIHDIEMIDGSIVLKEAAITNPLVVDLYNSGELPSFSPVGSGRVSTCPQEGIDYKLDSMVIDRIDFVQNGGCETCVVHNPPLKMNISGKTGYIQILQQKKENKEDDNMNKEDKSEEKKNMPKKLNKVKAADSNQDNSNTDNEINSDEVNTRLTAFEEEIQIIKDQLTALSDASSETVVEAEDPAATPEEDVQPDFDVESAVQALIDQGSIPEEKRDVWLELGIKLGEQLFMEIVDVLTVKSPDTTIQGKYSRNNHKIDQKEHMKFLARKYFRTKL